jgi:hypothetical protein
MAFQIITPKRMLLLEDEHQVLFELPAQLGVKAPTLAYFWDRFYADSRLDGRAVSALRAELVSLLAGYSAVVDAQLRAAGIPSIEARKKRNRDPLAVFIRDFVSICAEAATDGLSFSGD